MGLLVDKATVFHRADVEKASLPMSGFSPALAKVSGLWQGERELNFSPHLPTHPDMLVKP